MSVRGYHTVTAFCCLFRVILGLCMDVSPSLRFFSVVSPSVWCLSVITDGHASSDWSLGPMLVNVRLGVYMHRGWVVSGLFITTTGTYPSKRNLLSITKKATSKSKKVKEHVRNF